MGSQKKQNITCMRSSGCRCSLTGDGVDHGLRSSDRWARVLHGRILVHVPRDSLRPGLAFAKTLAQHNTAEPSKLDGNGRGPHRYKGLAGPCAPLSILPQPLPRAFDAHGIPGAR
jgi:hypothetical protein